MDIEKLKQIKDGKVKIKLEKEKKEQDKEKESQLLAQKLFNELNIFNISKEIESKLYSVINNISDEDLQEFLEICIDYDNKSYEKDEYCLCFHLFMPRIVYKREKEEKEGVFGISTTNTCCSFSYTTHGYGNAFNRNYDIGNVDLNFDYNIHFENQFSNESKNRMAKYLEDIFKEKFNIRNSALSYENYVEYEFSVPLHMENIGETVGDLLINRLKEFGCEINSISNNDIYFHNNLYNYVGFIDIKNPVK